MPLPMESGAPPGAPPAPSPPGQATGPNPATVPVPNRGLEQAALLSIGMLADQMRRKLMDLPFGSDAATQISEALNKIAKHVPPPGAAASGVEKAGLDQMRNVQAQNAMRMAMMRQQAAQAGAEGGGGQMMPPRPPAQLMQPNMGM